MERKIYIADEIIGLSKYIKSVDDHDRYECWQDKETQDGYNHKSTESFEEFADGAITSRFMATIVRRSDHARVGCIFVSPENTLPDLAIMMFKPYRGLGYGTRAFSLGVTYCFETLGLDHIYAGCYPHNVASFAMLKKCGFGPHPEGNQSEKHYMTGEDITQLDFVIYKHA